MFVCTQNVEPPPCGSRKGTKQPSRTTEQHQRRARQVYGPSLSPPSSPSLSTVLSLESDEDKYWQQVSSFDPDNQELCDLFDKVSLSAPDNKSPKAEHTRETAVTRTTPVPRSGGPQFPGSMPPTNPSHRHSTAIPPSPSLKPPLPLSCQVTPRPLPQPNLLGPEHTPKKYYVVTVGVVTSS